MKRKNYRFLVNNYIIIIAFTFLQCRPNNIYNIISSSYGLNSPLLKKGQNVDTITFVKSEYIVYLIHKKSSLANIKEIKGYLLGEQYGHYFQIENDISITSYQYKIGKERYFSYSIDYEVEKKRV